MTIDTDTQVVYGATCMWWDSIDKASQREPRPASGRFGIPAGTPMTGLPCCPHCKGPLFEVDSETVWWRDVDRFEAEGNADYRKFVTWLRGRCFPTQQEALDAFAAEEPS